MDYEVISIVKKVKVNNRFITFVIKDKTNDNTFEVIFRKFFIPFKNMNLEDKFKEQYSDYNFSNHLTDTSIGPGKMLKANNLPLELQNEEFYTLLISKCPLTLDFIDDDAITESMCKLAVSLDPMRIRNVFDKYRSDELIVSALKGNGITLQYIPKEKRTEEYCNIAFSSNPNSLKYIPLEFITYDRCIKAVINDKYCLYYVPKIWLLQVYKEAIIGRNITLPQPDGNKRHSFEAHKYKEIVSEIKGLLQRETSIPFGYIDPNSSLEEINAKVELLKRVLEENNINEENRVKLK